MHYVLVADDHEVTRRGIREILSDAYAGVEVHEARDANAVLAQLDAYPWDLILLDVRMPGPSVLEVLPRIRQASSRVPVLVVTAMAGIECVVQTMKAGANGVIHKHRASDELLAAVQTVMNGRNYLHAETAAEVAARLSDTPPALPHQKLSQRELEIFRLIALGRAVKEIAGELGLSDKTVATYLGRIRDKTGLSSHVDIARYALQHQLVD